MTEWLHFHFSLSCIGEGNGNPLQCSCLENPRDGGAWWAAVYGVAQSRARLKRLSSSSSSRPSLGYFIIYLTISKSVDIYICNFFFIMDKESGDIFKKKFTFGLSLEWQMKMELVDGIYTFRLGYKWRQGRARRILYAWKRSPESHFSLNLEWKMKCGAGHGGSDYGKGEDGLKMMMVVVMVTMG